MKCPAYTVTFDQWEWRIQTTDQLEHEDFLFRKGPAAIKYDKSAHSLRYEIMLEPPVFVIF